MTTVARDEEWPTPLPDAVVDSGAWPPIRHKPREHYGRRSYWTKCFVLAIEFPKGVDPSTGWVSDCPQCYPE